MNDMVRDWAAWIEDAAGQQIPIHGSCDLGRAGTNHVTVDDPLVSRRHAQIQAQTPVQGGSEYWLVDFGSRNGTYLNDQRIAQPTRLHDGDKIRIGGSDYRFRQITDSELALSLWSGSDQTIYDLRTTCSWLMVADIVDSTRLTKHLPPDELPLVTGRWLAGCRDTIEACGGRINQFTGDGFFAYWRDHPGREDDVVRAMQALRRQQVQAHPAFRFVLHLGPVVFGGMALGEEERISGGEVHFVFRMEKLAGRLGVPCLLSDPARERLGALESIQEAGSHVLPGFPEEVRFHVWAEPD